MSIVSPEYLRPAQYATLADILRWRAQHQPDREAYTFLGDGESVDQSLTYAELDQQARTIAAHLQRTNAAHQRALLLYPPGLAYVAAFFGCLYAGVVAVPAYPPTSTRLERMLPRRLRATVQDAQPILALTTTDLLPTGEALAAQDPAFGALSWLATDRLPDAADDWIDPSISTESLAFLQYTSGSTASPKGVMLTHANLLHNSHLIERCFGHTPESRGVIWLPPYHDMGLIGGILQTVYTGCPVILMPPISFLQRPMRWLEAISRFGATTSGGPNFAYELCLRRSTPEQRAQIDLSSWQVAFTGAEPVRAATLDRFADVFAACNFQRTAFYPCYGLAEATLIASGGQTTQPPVVQTFKRSALAQGHATLSSADQSDGHSLVSCGQALPDHPLIIADPTTLTPCPPGRIGEIWLSGPSIAQGYWGRTEQTRETFGAQLAETQGETWLRTGDLGTIHDGELFVTGRIKDLIIIRGRNHYPQDIELTVEESHPSLRLNSGAAFAVELDGAEHLVVVQEVERQHRHGDLHAVVQAIRVAVAQTHELQIATVVLVKPNSVPKTSSGKVQRSACRAMFLDGSLNELRRDDLASRDDLLLAALTPEPESVPSRTELARLAASERTALLTNYLQAIAARVLQSLPAHIDPQSPLSAQGLDSLGAVELQHQIELDLDVSVPMVVFLQEATIVQLTETIAAQLGTPSATTTMIAQPSAARAADDQPLTPGQRALWLLHQIAPESTAYTIASAARISADVDLAALHHAFEILIERHPALRTTFSAVDGKPRQQIHASLPVDFEIIEAAHAQADALNLKLLTETQRPFDLLRGPLLRVRVFACGFQEYVLLLLVHHSIADLWSLAVLTRELGPIYSALRQGSTPALAMPRLTYGDYAHWQAELLDGPHGEQLWHYWQQQLAGAETVLELPTDRPRPPVQTDQGATHVFKIPAALTGDLKALARSESATLYMLLLACWQTLLYRYTGQRDFLIGSPTTGRSRAEWADVVGYFVNPLVLRSQITGNPSFTEFLRQVRETVLGAFAHQDFPFALLVERMQPERDPSRSPLFQVMFVLQKAPGDNQSLAAFSVGDEQAQMNLDGLPLRSLPLEQCAVQFDLTLMIGESAQGLSASLLYNTDLFDASTIARMAQHMQHMLSSVVANPGMRLLQLPLLTADERHQQIHDWNQTTVNYPAAEDLAALFEVHAARTPEITAVAFEDTQISYGELNRRANQLAHHLRRLGVGPDVLVGICVDRSLNLVISLLAVLKAGGAFVPLDPTYPQERLQFMVQDSQVAVLLTHAAVTDYLDLAVMREAKQLIDLDRDWSQIAEESGANLPVSSLPEHLAYVIYTSGSMGRPKGTQVSRRSLLNLCRWYATHCPITAQSRVLLTISFSFDASFKNILVPLLEGGQLILAHAGFYNPAQLLNTIEQHQVTTINSTPSLMHPVIELAAARDYQPLSSLEYLALGGEPMVLAKLQPWMASPNCRSRFFNIYGPTECTDISTSYHLDPATSDKLPSVPIGAPIHNDQAFVLDRQLNLLPAGVPGELCIGGAGLARGYLHNAALTAEKFVPNPFEPGTRLYRTGDLVRWLPDGNLEFLGRIDQQIKLRGYRIELGEIEAALVRHPSIYTAVVVMHERGVGDQRLVAYIVPGDNPAQHQDQQPTAADHVASATFDSVELRKFLLATLPDYMVPSAFIFLDALPLTPSGKLDRKALPALETARNGYHSAGALEFVAPQSDIEQTIAQIWQDVLKIETISLHDNFFDLGGHSLLMAQVHSKIQERYPQPVSMIEMFKYPTIQSLADHLSQAKETRVVEEQQAQDTRAREGRNRLKEQRKQRQRLGDS